MIRLTTKKQHFEFEVPDGWHEVSFSHAYQILTQKFTDVELLALLSNKLVSDLRKVTDLEAIRYLIDSLTYLQRLPVKKNPEFPKTVTRLSHDPDHSEVEELTEIALPWLNYYDDFDLGGCSVGQVEDMSQVIKDRNAQTDLEVIEIYPKIVAIYLQPLFQPKDYSYVMAMKFAQTVEEDIDFKTVYNMGLFFLTRLSGSIAGSQNGSLPARSMKTKSVRALGGWVQRLVSMLP